MSVLEKYFASLQLVKGADEIIIVGDAAATSSPRPVSQKSAAKKTEQPSLNSFSELGCPPPSCPSRQESQDDLCGKTPGKANFQRKSSARASQGMEDFFAEVAPQLSPSRPSFNARRLSNSPSLLSSSPSKLSRSFHQKSKLLKAFLLEVEDLLVVDTI
jgi:hypothetical protein